MKTPCVYSWNSPKIWIKTALNHFRFITIDEFVFYCFWQMIEAFLPPN